MKAKTFYSPTKVLCYICILAGAIMTYLSYTHYQDMLGAVGWIAFSMTWFWYADVFEGHNSNEKTASMYIRGLTGILKVVFNVCKEESEHNVELKEKLHKAGFVGFEDAEWDCTDIKLKGSLDD